MSSRNFRAQMYGSKQIVRKLLQINNRIRWYNNEVNYLQIVNQFHSFILLLRRYHYVVTVLGNIEIHSVAFIDCRLYAHSRLLFYKIDF